MRIRLGLSAVLILALPVVACSSGSDPASPPSETSQVATTSAASAPSDTTSAVESSPAGATATSDDPTSDSTTSGGGDPATSDDSTSDPATSDGSDTGSAAAPSGDLAGLAKLSGEQMCALMPRDKVAAIVGADVDEGEGNAIDGSSVNCVFYDQDYKPMARAEFDVLDFASTAKILEIAGGDGATFESCTVAGKAALCRGPVENNGLKTGATVVVQLGSPSDIPLVVESWAGIDVAKKIAELILGNLPA